jgi:heptose I phosphotransferase
MGEDRTTQSLLDAVRAAGLDSLAGAFAWRGEDLNKPGLGVRKRTRVALRDADGGEHVLYLKRYGVPGKATLRGVRDAAGRWLAHGRRCSVAGAEKANIEAAAAAGVPTMRVVAWGQMPCPIGAAASYLLVTAVPGDALERCAETWLAAGGADRGEALAAALARLARRLHDSGYVHRDFYSSHVFLDDRDGRPELYLIDLARAIRPPLRRLRWLVKDVAQLKHSMPAAWTAAHWPMFVRHYLVGVSEGGMARFNRKVDGKVAAMRRKAERRE